MSEMVTNHHLKLAIGLVVLQRINPVIDQGPRLSAFLQDLNEAKTRKDEQFFGQFLITGASARPKRSPSSLGKAQLAHFHMKMLLNLLKSARFRSKELPQDKNLHKRSSNGFSVFQFQFLFATPQDASPRFARPTILQAANLAMSGPNSKSTKAFGTSKTHSDPFSKKIQNKTLFQHSSFFVGNSSRIETLLPN